MHLKCEYTVLGPFWRDVPLLAHKVYGIHITAEPKICIMGLLGDDKSSSVILWGILQILYQARKLNARYWIQPTRPTKTELISRMNGLIQLERGVN